MASSSSVDQTRSAFSALKCNTARGQPYDFSQLLAKSPEETRLTIFVNVASKCGLTPQYEGLEKLYKAYKDKGLEIVGFPCNQFMFQEPGSASDAEAVCKRNYGVTFQIMEKINVNSTMLGLGSKEHEVYQYLKAQIPGAITWNFQKYAIDGNGKVIKCWGPKTVPEDMEADIKAMLNLQ